MKLIVGAFEVVFFPILEGIAYFFNFLFNIFCINIYLTFVQQFEKQDLVYEYLFTSRGEFHAVPGMYFLRYTFTYFILVGVIEERVAKINSKYFNGK